MKKPELLAPAGDFSRLKYAVAYGADAVYIGGEHFSLRTASSNFNSEELQKAVRYAHSHQVKVYCAVNAVPRNAEIEEFPSYLKSLCDAGIDAVIVSDIGLVSMTRELAPEMKIHLSTQANAINYAACNAWYRLGVRRIVLARECSLEEIKEIRANVPEDLELEAFVHGAMCMAYSGRCLISSFMTGRDANRGNCAQPCRWKYAVCEETRPGEYFPLEEGDGGTFLFNSKDLCMIDHIPELCAAGVGSFKIEGRVKTEYYVSCVTNTYRQAIDACFDDIDGYVERLPVYLEELSKVSHREYSTGFYYGNPLEQGQNYESAGYLREYEVVGLVEGYDSLNRRLIVSQRNKFSAGETLELVEAGRPPVEFSAEVLYNGTGERILSAPHAAMRVEIAYDHYVGGMSFLRKKKY